MANYNTNISDQASRTYTWPSGIKITIQNPLSITSFKDGHEIKTADGSLHFICGGYIYAEIKPKSKEDLLKEALNPFCDTLAQLKRRVGKELADKTEGDLRTDFLNVNGISVDEAREKLKSLSPNETKAWKAAEALYTAEQLAQVAQSRFTRAPSDAEMDEYIRQRDARRLAQKITLAEDPMAKLAKEMIADERAFRESHIRISLSASAKPATPRPEPSRAPWEQPQAG